MITMSGPGAPQKTTVTQGIPNLHQQLQWRAQQNPMGCSKFCCHHWKTPKLQQKHVSQHDAMLNTTYGVGPGHIFVLVDGPVILQKRSEAAVHLSYLQVPDDIPWNIWNPDCFIGILIIAYYNPYRNWVVCHPLYTSISNQGAPNVVVPVFPRRKDHFPSRLALPKTSIFFSESRWQLA